jgi:hypothetical protein
MLRRCAGDYYSQSCVICRHLRQFVQFTRVPNGRLPARGFYAEYFRNFMASVGATKLLPAIPPPRKNPDAAACPLSR